MYVNGEFCTIRRVYMPGKPFSYGREGIGAESSNNKMANCIVAFFIVSLLLKSRNGRLLVGPFFERANRN